MAFGQLSLKGRALRYLSRREHSRAELARKLRPHALDCAESSASTQISQALDELAAQGLLSDERAAQSVLNLRAPRYGERRLRQDLQAKGLAPELISQTLQQARGTESERALQVWQRKFGQTPANAAEAARQMRFLAGRGFGGEVIRQLLQRVRADRRDGSSDDDRGDHHGISRSRETDDIANLSEFVDAADDVDLDGMQSRAFRTGT
jgi:regulatory protein